MFKRTAVLTLVFVFLLPLSLFVNAQKLPTTSPENVGLSSARLERIEPVVRKYIDENQLSGAVCMILRHDKVAYCKSFGIANIEGKRPMSDDSLFRIASMSKAITTLGAMILYEEGRFLLSDPLSNYLPKFKDMKVIVPDSTGNGYHLVPANKPIQIRHIMNHTAGFTYGGGPQRDYYRKAGMTVGLTPTEGTLEAMIDKLAELPLISQPGEEFHYGMSIDVLGRFIEVVSGKPLDVFLRERTFEPLGMKDTGFILPREKLPRLARLYRRNGNGVLEQDKNDPSYLCTQTYFSGGAGLVSSAPDYARFAQMVLNGGELDGVRLVSRKTIELMSTNSIGDLYSAFREDSGDKFGYGFGIRTERGVYDELESLGIIGWDGAFCTRFWIDPKEDLVGIFMIQGGGSCSELKNKYRVLVYQAIVD